MSGRVVLAMSGGVDSSASAVLLQRQGYEVVGLFMRTGSHTDTAPTRPDHKKGCCSAIDAGDARRVADMLDIPFYALDFEREFDKIIDYFADEYLKGRTPNPCVVCNTWLKFGQLWDFGKKLGCEYIATGHYAQIVKNAAGESELHRAVDPDKDQSYVLHGIRREILDRLLFPVGGYTKPEIRRITAEAGLPVSQKPDSVEICFVPSGNHIDVVRQRRPNAQTAGTIVDTHGNTLGEHDGIDRFTIGQRKGLGVGGGGTKRFVLEIVADSNQVVVGEEKDLLADGLLASRVNWMIEPGTVRECEAKIRYRHQSTPVRVEVLPDGEARVQFHEPQSAVTPGQAVVFYDGNRVLGGGWIEKVFRDSPAVV